jgi:peroxiredoxin
VYAAIRQYGRALVARDELSGRLTAVERALGELSAQVANAGLGAAQSHAGHQHPAPALPDGLPLGSPAPDFNLPDLAGNRHTLADFAGTSKLLVFFSPSCGYCQQMAPRIGELAQDGPRVLVIGQGEADAYRQLIREHHWSCDVLLDDGAQVADSYRYGGTPTGYLLDAEGRIASSLAIGADALLRLVPAGPAVAATNGHAADNAGGATDVLVRAPAKRRR